VNLHPTRLADVASDLRKVGAAIGRDAEAAVASMEAHMESVRVRAANLPRPRVLTIEWLEPIMVGGTWMPELVALAGGEALVTRAGDHAPTLRDEELLGLDPAVVLLKPCGFDVGRTLAERNRVRVLRAMFPRARVYVADGSAYFNRPGPRLADSLEILASAVHPEVFGDDPRLVAIPGS
jgi:iron complex transport system substrate-binding protein